jgi:imidazole glycerol phosphate synthase glutamine amidotransferase subunit
VKVGIIDYGGGNLRSVQNAVHALGHDPQIVAKPEDAAGVSHLIFPGQGAFGDCMVRLEDRGLDAFLKTWIAADRPYFGICVGYQLLFGSSEEAPAARGLGVLAGKCVRFSGSPGAKIPHMGWNSAIPARGETAVWHDLGPEPYFYYVHSYFPEPEHAADTVAETEYAGRAFAGAVERGRLFACQFHPEKSQDAGLQLLRNFLSRE